MSWTIEDISGLRIDGTTSDELGKIRGALKEWRARRGKNLKRSLYYDTEQAFKDLGLTLPPQLKNAKFYLGWGMQAVRKPAMRSQFDGLRLPGSDDPFELGEILAGNRFGLEFSQSVISANKHGCAFATIARGGPGEVPAQILFHSAETSVGIWDRRRRGLSLCLTVSAMDDDSNPTQFVVYMAHDVLTCTRTAKGWRAQRHGNPTGRILAVPVTHDPQLTRPLGRSRLTNSVMALCDMAVRAYVRMEGNAEFYSTPQLAMLGVDPDAFGGAIGESEKFKLAMDRFIALTKDKDGDKPDLKQLQQATMTPHSDMLRTVAMAFSGETDIPPSSLGIIHDQPASAEAIRAAEHDLLINATYQNKYVLNPAVVEIATLAVMVRDNLKAPPDEAWKLSARFADPEFSSVSAQADAVQKLGSSMDQLAKHPVLLNRIFDENEVEQVVADARRASVSDLTRNIADRAAKAREDERVNAAVGERGAGE
ncbi:phage portal protein [Arthrobacter rhombi]|uniref:phage portal protein n=1 Tax=Arthrobacter rhombi TaxID=71253 RepID=UPI003FD4A46C